MGLLPRATPRFRYNLRLAADVINQQPIGSEQVWHGIGVMRYDGRNLFLQHQVTLWFYAQKRTRFRLHLYKRNQIIIVAYFHRYKLIPCRM